MKKASAARRRDGNYGKHNLRQYPVFILGDRKTAMELGDQRKERQRNQAEHRARSKDTRRPNISGNERVVNRIATQLLLSPESLPPSPSLPAKDYELTTAKADFNLLDLSTLATLHIGRAVRASLSQNPYHLIHQLRSHQRWSYLTFLPSRYGQSKCLSDATDCVIARARQIISPWQNWEAAVITFYVKALDSLQKALDCPKQRFQPDVLAATEILALYEVRLDHIPALLNYGTASTVAYLLTVFFHQLLDPSGETAWVRHTAGAAKLVQLRGPKNYNTEFEKAVSWRYVTDREIY